MKNLFFTIKHPPMHRMVSNLHIQYKHLGHIFSSKIGSEKNYEPNQLPDRCGLGPLFSSQLLPHSHTAPNQLRTTKNIVVYLYKKTQYNANLIKPTKRKEIRTNLYLFQFHIALKIGLGEEPLFGLSECTIFNVNKNKKTRKKPNTKTNESKRNDGGDRTYSANHIADYVYDQL